MLIVPTVFMTIAPVPPKSPMSLLSLVSPLSLMRIVRIVLGTPLRSLVAARTAAHVVAPMATRSAAIPREPYAFTEPTEIPSTSET